MSDPGVESPAPEGLLAPPPREALTPAAETPSFSVVIATYQAAETVGRSITSALKQSNPAQEVIVVDDGSTDDLDAALRPFDGQITLIRKQNGGGASALNAGIEAASGDFLAILDADDEYEPRRLEVLAAAASARPDLDLVTTDAVFVTAEGEAGTFASSNPFATEGQRTAIFERCFPGGWPAIRLTRLREIGGFDERLRTGYDWDCWLRLLLDGSAAGMSVEPLYRYYLHYGSLTASRTSSLWDRVSLLEKARQNPGLRENERPALERSIRSHRARAVASETQASLYQDPDRRRLCHLAIAGGVDGRTRLLALVAALAPALARRIVPPYRSSRKRPAGHRD